MACFGVRYPATVLSLAVAFVLLLSAPALADRSTTTVRLKDGRVFSFWYTDSRNLRVRSGARSASMRTISQVKGIELSSVLGATISRDQKTVILNLDDYTGPTTSRVPVTVIESRLANSAAIKLHRAKRHAEAAVGFANAAALDSTFDQALTNQASALCLAKMTVEAAVAVAPLIARSPMELAFKIDVDPQLDCLRLAPAITSIKVNKPGTARISQKTIDLMPVYSQDKSRIAMVVHDPPGGFACLSSRTLVILNANTGQHLFSQPLISFGEGYYEENCTRLVQPRFRKQVSARILRFNRVLADFGFNSISGVLRGRVVSREAASDIIYLTKAKVSVVTTASDPPRFKVFRGGKVIATTVAPANVYGFDHAFYLPAATMIVIVWTYDHGHNDDVTYVHGIKVPALTPGEHTKPASET